MIVGDPITRMLRKKEQIQQLIFGASNVNQPTTWHVKLVPFLRSATFRNFATSFSTRKRTPFVISTVEFPKWQFCMTRRGGAFWKGFHTCSTYIPPSLTNEWHHFRSSGHCLSPPPRVDVWKARCNSKLVIHCNGLVRNPGNALYTYICRNSESILSMAINEQSPDPEKKNAWVLAWDSILILFHMHV